ncbi:MAG: DUF3566 domain-containing protein [Actinomycetota bacterium]
MSDGTTRATDANEAAPDEGNAMASEVDTGSVADRSGEPSSDPGSAQPAPPTAVIGGGHPAVAGPAIHAPQPSRKARVVVRKVGPWSVLKFSLLFYLCVMLVVLLAGTMLYLVLDALGTIDAAVELAVNLSVVEAGFAVDGNWLFWRALSVGLIGVVLWSLVNVFVIFLYNLISDVVGGIEVTLGEKRSRRG